MNTVRRLFALTALITAVVTILPTVAAAQDLHSSRRPSPMGMARISLDDTYVRVIYSRPYLRGRDNIFGTEESEALVPFGKIWRTGANEATEITVTGDVLVGGERLPAGTYSVFTTPGPDQWKVHFNSELGLSGTVRFDPETRQAEQAYSPENDVATVTAPATAIEGDPVDQFTISFDRTDAGADMVFQWHQTEVRVPIALPGA